MKIKKKQAIVVSFVIGSMLFITTAFAEISAKSGYEQLKDTLKYTAENCASKLSSYTTEVSMVIKDNGNIVAQQNEVSKYDITNGARDNRSTTVENGKASEGYNYSDKNETIYYSKDQDSYFVTKFSSQSNSVVFRNPFKENRASDMERIADAIIGNLKDSVVVKENADGTKHLSGSVSEAQIPAVANALVSYYFKGRFGNPNRVVKVEDNSGSTMPNLVDDIYVKEIKGDLTANKDGLMESAMGTGVISGKDDKAKEHTMTFEILIKISDVDKTVVNKPVLTGKKVETRVQKDYTRLARPEMYLGTYKNDIIIEKDSMYKKIGERIVEITSIDDKKISGRYHEEFIKDYEEYASKAMNFKFNSIFHDGLNSNFESVDTAGNKVVGNLWIDAAAPRIGFNINEARAQDRIFINYGDYTRVFN